MTQREIEIAVTDGLMDYLAGKFGQAVPVIRANQTAPMPRYPYMSYSTLTPLDITGKSWNEDTEGNRWLQVPQVWSFTAQSSDQDEADDIMQAAFVFFDSAGTVLLDDAGISVERVGAVTNRDNFLTVDYEYRRGFDVTISTVQTMDASDREYISTISTVEISDNINKE